MKNQLSLLLTRARKNREPVIVTRHGKPYAIIQPLFDEDLDALAWNELGKRRLARAWEGEPDELYDYL